MCSKPGTALQAPNPATGLPAFSRNPEPPNYPRLEPSVTYFRRYASRAPPPGLTSAVPSNWSRPFTLASAALSNRSRPHERSFAAPSNRPRPSQASEQVRSRLSGRTSVARSNRSRHTWAPPPPVATRPRLHAHFSRPLATGSAHPAASLAGCIPRRFYFFRA